MINQTSPHASESETRRTTPNGRKTRRQIKSKHRGTWNTSLSMVDAAALKIQNETSYFLAEKVALGVSDFFAWMSAQTYVVERHLYQPRALTCSCHLCRNVPPIFVDTPIRFPLHRYLFLFSKQTRRMHLWRNHWKNSTHPQMLSVLCRNLEDLRIKRSGCEKFHSSAYRSLCEVRTDAQNNKIFRWFAGRKRGNLVSESFFLIESFLLLFYDRSIPS